MTIRCKRGILKTEKNSVAHFSAIFFLPFSFFPKLSKTYRKRSDTEKWIRRAADAYFLTQTLLGKLFSFAKNVDYKAVREFKIPLLKLAASRFDKRDKDYISFC